MTCPHARHLGVFVLGIDDSGRPGFERHLEDCPICQAELSELAGLAPLLATVERSELETVVEQPVARPPDELLDRVLASISAEQHGTRSRRRRRRFGLAAAAVLIVGGSVIGAGVGLQNWPAADPIPLVRGHSEVGVRATATMLPQAWGTRIDVTLSGLPPAYSCRLVARAADGRTETAATWHVTYEDSLDVRGMTSIPSKQLAELQVIDDTGRELVTIPVRPA